MGWSVEYGATSGTASIIGAQSGNATTRTMERTAAMFEFLKYVLQQPDGGLALFAITLSAIWAFERIVVTFVINKDKTEEED
jgi:hypothetical protein